MHKAKVWYIDATFSIVDKPFMQLFSCHVMVSHNCVMQQIPVCFVLMARRRKLDYKQVFEAFVELATGIDGTPPKVEKIMLDFEAAMWTSLREMMNDNTFPTVQLKGCLFHFNQALFKKILGVGLKDEYYKDIGTQYILQQLLCLPLLPAEKIVAQFNRLELMCNASTHRNAEYKELAAYVRSTWIDGRLWTPVDWCQYRQLIRTNNDLEGYHNGLNQRIQRCNRPFYGLAKGLQKEADAAGLKIIDVHNGITSRKRRNPALVHQENLTKLWNLLARKELKSQAFLERARQQYANANERWALTESRIDLLEDLD